MMDDPKLLWGELYARILRAGGRLENRFGTCPSCDLGASDAANFRGIVWSYCAWCFVRWPVLDPLAKLDPMDDEFLELFVEALSMCIDLDPFPAEISPPAFEKKENRDMRKETTTTPASFGIDPQKFQGPRETLVLSPLMARHRIALTDAIVNDMVEHPPFVRHQVRGTRMLSSGADGACWHRVRSVVVDPDSGATFETVLRSDAGVSPFAIKNVMELLLSLQDRRALLEEQLHALDVIAEVFRPSTVEAEAS